MDCGPAALKCLLEGFGISVSYGRLREACQTAVDGTSIDSIEALARTLGLDAEQEMMPVDHVLLPEAQALPAIVIVRLPGGNRHFLVVWRRHGQWVQVMDPLRGRRWVRRRDLERELFVHSLPLAAETFRQWAGSEGFLDPLRRRLHALALADEGHASLQAALADPTWRGIAALDTVVRTVAALVESGALAAGAEAERLVATLLAQSSAEAADNVALPVQYTTARAAPPAPDGTEQIWLRGAVLVTIAGAAPLAEEQRGELPRELRAAIDEARERPAASLLGLLRQDGLLRWSGVFGALLLAAAGAVLETVLFRGLFDRAAGQAPALLARVFGRAPSGPDSMGSLTGVWSAVLILVTGLLAVELPVALSLRGAGRRLESRMRRAFARKIPRLDDRYFQTRPISDMVERAHLAHHLRALPALGGQIVRTIAEVIVTAAVLAWLYPAGATLAVVLAVAMLLLPLTAQTALTERDLRMRSHAGALARFYPDALLGLVAVRTHRAEDAMVSEHRDRLREWLAASGATLRAALTAEVVQSTIGFGLAAWLLAGFVGSGSALRGGAGAALLVIYWSLSLPALGNEIGFLVRQYPQQRNVTLRLMEPLGAPEGEVGAAAPVAPSANPPIAKLATRTPGPTPDRPPVAGARVQISDLEVRVAGHTILTVGGLTIAPGEQIAIVGPSGAGKSTLLALLLGWHRASAGVLLVDGQPLLADALERLRRATVWVDPAVYLWNRSLHANLAFGLNAAPPSLAAVIDEAELGDVVRRLPGGVQGSLGEAGALVSGGEGQRVRFARGLCREPPRLVVLDEPFRGLTREQRHRLLARARERWVGATLLCVTHDIGETLVFPSRPRRSRR